MRNFAITVIALLILAATFFLGTGHGIQIASNAYKPVRDELQIRRNVSRAMKEVGAHDWCQLMLDEESDVRKSWEQHNAE